MAPPSVTPIYTCELSIILLLCYSLTENDDTIDRLREISRIVDDWNHREHYVEILKILVSYENQNAARVFSYEKGLQLKEELGAIAYIECSLETGEGIEDVFMTAVEAVLASRDQVALIKPLNLDHKLPVKPTEIQQTKNDDIKELDSTNNSSEATSDNRWGFWNTWQNQPPLPDLLSPDQSQKDGSTMVQIFK